jgi:hypothetical protein
VQPDAGFFLASLPRFETSEITKSSYPALSSLASQIEMFGLSKRELETKFTRSEMIILAWRSQEMAHLLDNSTKETTGDLKGISTRQHMPGTPQGLPDHFFRKDYDPIAGIGSGELDLRLVTGEEAYKYFSAIGIKLPIMGGM